MSLKSSKIGKFKSEKYNFMHSTDHVGFDSKFKVVPGAFFK